MTSPVDQRHYKTRIIIKIFYKSRSVPGSSIEVYLFSMLPECITEECEHLEFRGRGRLVAAEQLQESLTRQRYFYNYCTQNVYTTPSHETYLVDTPSPPPSRIVYNTPSPQEPFKFPPFKQCLPPPPPRTKRLHPLKKSPVALATYLTKCVDFIRKLGIGNQ